MVDDFDHCLCTDMYHKSWSNFHDLVKQYKSAGIQMFTHQSYVQHFTHSYLVTVVAVVAVVGLNHLLPLVLLSSHEIYACQGPYIPDWEKVVTDL